MMADPSLQQLQDAATPLRPSVPDGNAPGLNVEPIAGANFIMETVRLIDETPVSELETKLPSFIQGLNQNAFVLGGILEKIRREKFWNPGSKRPHNALFERWVETTCHYSGRKARYLISVYVGIVQASIPSSRVVDIGWSKLRMIAPHLRPVHGHDLSASSANAAHNEQLIRLARRKSRKALEAALRSKSQPQDSLPAVSAASPKTRRLVFNVRDDAAEVVSAALVTIEKETGHTGAAALVDMACAIESRVKVPTLEYFMRRAGRDIVLSTYVKLFGQPGDN